MLALSVLLAYSNAKASAITSPVVSTARAFSIAHNGVPTHGGELWQRGRLSSSPEGLIL